MGCCPQGIVPRKTFLDTCIMVWGTWAHLVGDWFSARILHPKNDNFGPTGRSYPFGWIVSKLVLIHDSTSPTIWMVGSPLGFPHGAFPLFFSRPRIKGLQGGCVSQGNNDHHPYVKIVQRGIRYSRDGEEKSPEPERILRLVSRYGFGSEQKALCLVTHSLPKCSRATPGSFG